MENTAASKELPLGKLYEFWDQLRDVPTVNEGENEGALEEKFLHFEAGTPREDVWRWLESQNRYFIVGEVMEGVRRIVDTRFPESTPAVRYKNPWHKPNTPHYGPEYYSTTVKPTEHAGHLIYERVDGHVWDVVKNGACVTQRAGPNGAKAAAEDANRPAQEPAAKKSGPSM